MGNSLSYSVRTLRNSPRFAVTAILVLGLGIGANTAIFSLVYSVLLRPLPYHAPDRLAVILGTSEKHGGSFSMPPADFLDYRDRNHSFGTLAAAEVWSPSLTGSGEAEELHGLRASASLFEVLGVSAAAGRLFLPEDGRSDATPVVVLGAGLWKRRFNGDRGILGRKVTLNKVQYAVAGVLPENFYFPPFWASDAEIFTPLIFAPAKAHDRAMSTLRVFGRLKPGVGWTQASEEMRNVARQLARENPRADAGKSAVVAPLHEMAVGKVRTSLGVLLFAVGCTLLIACANLANLFLARATGRQKEIAIRKALGAARGVLVRQLLTESFLVAFAAGILGWLMAWWAVSAFVAALPAAGNFKMPRHQEIALGTPVLLFHFAVCAITGLIAGILPALRASGGDLNRGLNATSRGSTSDRSGTRIRGALVVSEIALALMLLAGAGLLMESFRKLRDINAGFDPDHALAISTAVAGSSLASPDRRSNFYREAVERISRLPGVMSASAVNHVPLAGDTFVLGVLIEGRPAPKPEDMQSAVYRVALPGYFRTMGMHLTRGREFDARDVETAPSVAVINETMARRYWPGQDAVAQRFRLETSGSMPPWMTVVGVVKDARQSSWAGQPDPEMYLPYLQSAAYLHSPMNFLTMTLVVRTAAETAPVADLIRGQIREMDRNVPVTAMLPMEQVIAGAVWQAKLSMAVFSAFAALALVLATTGIFAVMSYIVAGRTQEIGIRMALGARQADVLWMVLWQSLRPVALGVVAGLCGAAALTRVMRSLLFDVSPSDPLVLACVTMVLVLVAVVAGSIPAWRAARIDPLVALRFE